MSDRTAARMARGLAALALTLLVSGYVVSLTGGAGIELGQVFIMAIAVTFSVVGALVASRHPGNAIGWIFLGAAGATGLGTLAGGYADYWVVHGGRAEALGNLAAWYANVSWVPFILVPPTFLLLLFPDERLLSRRWRPVAWSAAAGIVGNFAAVGLRPGPLDHFPEVANPYGVTSP